MADIALIDGDESTEGIFIELRRSVGNTAIRPQGECPGTTSSVQSTAQRRTIAAPRGLIALPGANGSSSMANLGIMRVIGGFQWALEIGPVRSVNSVQV
ncbi:hypothetical protein N7532_005489 [Penicillium argentinense]|uniref:Uncharacterized protein n=1 Tax=Penicillium argentinense TaxID=1131581 RepID=A0A9W9KA06_9EURO|nr:uncharacterized protein N7532_005489 [Penicillium argentinense]KAJ5098488.1 hypothetical protein N7532_005489 [Penicillium argentinense]